MLRVLMVASCIFVSSSAGEGEKVRKDKTVAKSAGPEATMVVDARHFCSAHKVRLD